MKQARQAIFLGNNQAVWVSDVFQWDKGQTFKFAETFPAGTEVQFSNGEVKVIVNNAVTIPNDILETAGTKSAYIQIINANEETTKKIIYFEVVGRKKKNDYVSDEDAQTWREDIAELIEQAGQPSTEEIEAVIASYINENKDELKGDDGADGSNGADGVSPTITKSAIANGTRLTIISAGGTETVDITNGTNGTNGNDGRTPVKNVDYFTEADKAEMVQAVLNALPSAESVSI